MTQERFAALAGVLLLVLSFGCSNSAAVDRTSSSLSGTDTSPSSATEDITTTSNPYHDTALADEDLVEPLLEFQSQGLTSAEFHNDRARTLSSCMQQRGWTFEPLLQNSNVAEPRTVGELREFRSTYGYGQYTTGELADSSTQEAADRNHEYYVSLSADEQRAYREDLNGDISSEGNRPSEGSCEALAEDAVKVPGTDQAVMAEMRILYEAALQSPEYLHAFDDWTACLNDRGYEVSRARPPFLLVEERAEAGAPMEQLVPFEVEVAVADFECALTTKMPVSHRLELEIVEELVEKYPEWGS